MLVQPLLGSTSFDTLQISLELIYWIFLIYAFLKLKHYTSIYFLITLYIFSNIGSFFLNDIHTFLLNLKIYGLFIFTLIYFSKVYFYPKNILYFFLYLNILYAVLAKHFNIWIIESLPFFNKQDAYLFSRPIGLLGSPHATSTFLCIFFLYLFHNKKEKVLQLLIFYSLYLFSSWTVVIGLIVSIIYLWIIRFIKYRLSPFLFFILGLFISFIGIEFILSFSKEIELSRFYSLEIMAPMLFDYNYYKDIFHIFPSSHDILISNQEKTFASVGNELGIVKIIVEGGVLLSLTSLYFLFKKIDIYVIFFLVTLLHYSFFINMPFILFSVISFTNEIKNSTTNQNLK